MKNIRIATYNICSCRNFEKGLLPNQPFDVRAVADTLRELNADIVGLNEVFDKGEGECVEQSERLRALAGYPFSYFSPAWKGIYGNALLSRFPIRSVKTVAVPAPSPADRPHTQTAYYEDRAVLCAVLDIGQPITLLVTHFGLNPCEQERMAQTLCKLIDESNYPVLLTGDFNVSPQAPLLAPIYERLKSVAKECGNTQFTFATYQPRITIDYLFIPKQARVRSFEVRSYCTSDHFPCVAELEL